MVVLWATVGFAGEAVVTTLVEPGVYQDGLCSLSEAIDFVNNGTSDGSGCAGDYYPDTVNLTGLKGTIVLQRDLPNVSPTLDTMTILGPGADQLTIDAGGVHRGLATSGQSVTLNLSGVTIHDAVGGALVVESHDTAIVSACAFTGSTTTSNGGGIVARGTLELSSVLVSGNETTGSGISQGGGVWSDGVLLVRDSSIVDNTSTTSGGGVFVGAHGTATIVNTTISGNTAQFGAGLAVINAFGEDPGPTATVISSTISGNAASNAGGGLVVSGTAGRSALTLGRTIVAGNTAAKESPDCSNDDGTSGTITSLGHNLVGIAERCTPAATGEGDLVGSVASPVDPLLSALAPQGSHLPTHRPLQDSPAIDAVADGACLDEVGGALSADERGFARPADGCDIGAHEIGCGDGVVDFDEECDSGPLPSDTCEECLLLAVTTTPTDTGAPPVDTGNPPGDTVDTGDGTAPPEGDRGCGCVGAPTPAFGWLALVLVALGRRRSA